MTDLFTRNVLHITLTPSGGACNLSCHYCILGQKSPPFPRIGSRMPEEVHDAFMRQLLETCSAPLVNISWQGGEPALAGLEFFEHSLRVQSRYRGPCTHVENIFHTNGTLINERWCEFFHANDFLVELSMDGPRELHNIYRKDKAGRGTFHKAFKAFRLLQKNRVRHRIHCSVNRVNGRHPLTVYRFFRDELQAGNIRFVPVVELESNDRSSPGKSVTFQSVRPHQWGRFLVEIFNEWSRQDMNKVSIDNFDSVLARLLDLPGPLCELRPACGENMAFDHNGDVYSCIRYMEPARHLGNIFITPLKDLFESEKFRQISHDKKNALPGCCRECAFLSVCNGGCPIDRFAVTPHRRSGLNYLCAGYRTFFRHSSGVFGVIAEHIREGRPFSPSLSVRAEA